MIQALIVITGIAIAIFAMWGLSELVWQMTKPRKDKPVRTWITGTGSVALATNDLWAWTTYSDGTNLIVSNNFTGTVRTNSP